KNFRSSKLYPKIRMRSGNTEAGVAFSSCAAARFLNLHLSQVWNARADGTFGSPVRFDDYERAGDHKADRAVSIRFVSYDADAQRDQFLANHFHRLPSTAPSAIGRWPGKHEGRAIGATLMLSRCVSREFFYQLACNVTRASP